MDIKQRVWAFVRDRLPWLWRANAAGPAFGWRDAREWRNAVEDPTGGVWWKTDIKALAAGPKIGASLLVAKLPEGAVEVFDFGYSVVGLHHAYGPSASHLYHDLPPSSDLAVHKFGDAAIDDFLIRRRLAYHIYDEEPVDVAWDEWVKRGFTLGQFIVRYVGPCDNRCSHIDMSNIRATADGIAQSWHKRPKP